MTDELVIRDEHAGSLTLFGTSDPSAVVERAAKVATALQDIIDKKQLFKSIGGKKHVLVEGWTCLGSMLGVFPRTAWTKPLENGWEARVEVVNLSGAVISAASCTRDEANWGKRDDYALRSMAQTRATSKALRMPLGFIAVLAGYSGTPAEEMPQEATGSRVRPPAAVDGVLVGEIVDESDVPLALRADPNRVYEADPFAEGGGPNPDSPGSPPPEDGWPGSFVIRIGKNKGMTLDELGASSKGKGWMKWALENLKDDDSAATEHLDAIREWLGAS